MLGGHADCCVVEEFFDGEDLDAGVGFFPDGGGVEACGGGFGLHVSGGLFEGEEYADGGFFAFDCSNEIPDVS